MKQCKTIIAIVTVILLTSCASTNKPGVIYEGKKSRIVGGNASHFQQRHDYKLRQDSIKLAKN